MLQYPFQFNLCFLHKVKSWFPDLYNHHMAIFIYPGPFLPGKWYSNATLAHIHYHGCDLAMSVFPLVTESSADPFVTGEKYSLKTPSFMYGLVHYIFASVTFWKNLARTQRLDVHPALRVLYCHGVVTTGFINPFCTGSFPVLFDYRLPYSTDRYHAESLGKIFVAACRKIWQPNEITIKLTTMSWCHGAIF